MVLAWFPFKPMVLARFYFKLMILARFPFKPMVLARFPLKPMVLARFYTVFKLLIQGFQGFSEYCPRLTGLKMFENLSQDSKNGQILTYFKTSSSHFYREGIQGLIFFTNFVKS